MGSVLKPPVLVFLSLSAGHRRRIAAAEHFLDGTVPDHLDLRVGAHPILQDLLGAQAVAAVDQGDLVRQIGQEQRLLDGGIAAADHRDPLVA